MLAKLQSSARRYLEKVLTWGRVHPRQLLFATAAFSVILSCYPVVFFGKSFLSPNNHSHTFLLYGKMPTVPGYKQVATDDPKGSDLGAAMWYSWPASVVESRSLFKDFQLPLWNRYDSAGLPLLGQGQSMFGEPLHWLVLLAGGSPGSWDLKYLAAKYLFVVAVGFCVLRLTKHLPAAVIVSLSAPFLGFYSYRYSHPAFFSFSYAPLILLCWLNLVDRPGRRASAGWLAMMVLANWMVLTSGTVKEAYILLLGMNACGGLTLLVASGVEARWTKLRQAFLVLVLFLFASAPIWRTFLRTLRQSWTAYDAGGVYQIQPSLIAGLFDDIFYQQFNLDEYRLDPSANFLVLIAVLWFVFSRSRADASRVSWGLQIVALVSMAFAFGVVPPWLILRIPFLDRIYHIDNTFSCIAVISLLVLTGFGVRAFFADSKAADFNRTAWRVLAGLAVVLALYLGTTEAAQRSTKTLLQIGTTIEKSSFFWGYSSLLLSACVIAPWVGRKAVQSGAVLLFWPILTMSVIFCLLHWRFGMHLATPFDPYVMNPQPRVNLRADASPAVRLIKESGQNPSRVAGLDYNLFPGYGAALGLEQVDSPEPLVDRRYKALLEASGVTLLFDGAQKGVLQAPLGQDLPLLNMLNVRYYLGGPTTATDPAPAVTKIASLDLDVYESIDAWPRAFFVDRAARYQSPGDFVSLLRHGDGKPFAAIATEELNLHPELKELHDDAADSTQRQVVAATDYALTTNTTSFKIRAPGPGLVVLTEPYAEKNFQLRVNGRKAPYFCVNSAFRGVLLPAAGDYDLSFTYWPQHWPASLCASALGLAVLASWIAAARRYSRRAT